MAARLIRIMTYHRNACIDGEAVRYGVMVLTLLEAHVA